MKKIWAKNTVWLLAGLLMTILPLVVFWYLESIPVDCDQFSCIGYLVLLGPVFLLGILLLMILLLVHIIMLISYLLKNKEDEECH